MTLTISNGTSVAGVGGTPFNHYPARKEYKPVTLKHHPQEYFHQPQDRADDRDKLEDVDGPEVTRS